MSGGTEQMIRINSPEDAPALIAANEARSAAGRPPFVIDTCVAVKWYIPEPLSTEARRYMGTGIDRHAPDYLRIEGASVALKRTRRQPDNPDRLTTEQARMVIEALPLAPIQYQPSGPLVDLAFALAAQVGTSLYDGLFLALALQMKGRLVTADRKFYDKLAASPYAPLALWVEQEP